MYLVLTYGVSMFIIMKIWYTHSTSTSYLYNGYINSFANTVNSYTNQSILSFEGQCGLLGGENQNRSQTCFTTTTITDIPTLPTSSVQTSPLTLLKATQTALLAILTERKRSQAGSESLANLINDHSLTSFV